MPTNYYVFVDRFTAPCDKSTAYQYISHIEEYPRWWGKVYKKIVRLKDVPPDSIGAQYEITVSGFLPYSLTLNNEVTVINKPDRIEFKAWGDLEGNGTWLFNDTEGGTEITFDWRVAANKSVLRWLSFILKPLFRANHAYCVRKANEGLRRDLIMRRDLSLA